MQDKTNLRNKAKKIRKTLDIHSVSAKICKQIFASEIFKNSKHIMIFYPLAEEINLLALLKDKTKNFYLPKICGKTLLICPFCEGDELRSSHFNTQEPLTEPVLIEKMDLIILPALAADKQGYRLGYGGGFYDRLLACPNCPKTAVVISKELLFDTIPHETYDKKTDFIFTDK